MKCAAIKLVLFGTLVAAGAASLFAAPREKPNIVLIMADDMGYECVAANGGAPYKTPALDRLAETGMRFDHCYSQPLCTPSRVKLMTGMNNSRNYTTFGVLDRGQTTFAHLLKEVGYATCVAGKWQLGKEDDSPRHFGFDESCLWQHTRRARDKNNRDTRYSQPHLEIDGQPVDYKEGEYGPDVVSDFLCHFMERHKDKPFLAYYPMILPHSPFVPTPDSTDPMRGDTQKNFVDMAQHVDKVVGKIVAKLDELGLRENTLVIFTGDNGTGHAINSTLNGKPFRGGKGEMTDAGTHVPLIANWPGVIPAGTVNGDLVDFSDFLPTICDVAGIAIPEALTIDGHSILPQLRGETGTPREWAYCWYRRGGQGKAAVWARTQQYKLYGTGEFYDIPADPDEKSPLKKLTSEQEAVKAVLQKAIDQNEAARGSGLKRTASLLPASSAN